MMEPEDGAEAVEALCRRAFGPAAFSIDRLDDVNRGRGAFSVVLRAELTWLEPPDDGGEPGNAEGRPNPLESAERPLSVVAKLPVPGPNGQAAAASGAYRRESLAYRDVLPHSPIAHPKAWAIVDGPDGDTCSLLLQDLSDHRLADQLDGLAPADAIAIARSLARFHRAWAEPAQLLGDAVRRNTLAGFTATALDAGLLALDERWSEVLEPAERAVYAELVAAHPALAERFGTHPATLCHGDPRADNLAFDPVDGHPVLFDWQQMAVQFGEADVAWLAATSLTIETRRQVEHDLVDAAGGVLDRYRLGLALPGLAVLLLAQRELPTERGRRFVALSLQRIAAALADNETAKLGRPAS